MRATWGLIAVAVGCGGTSGGDTGDSRDSLVIDRDDVDLGAVAVGQRGEAAFVVRNAGSDEAGPLETGVSGSSSFAITASTCAGMLAPSATCEVTVEFGPTQVGQEQATLSIEGGAVVVESQLAATGVVEVTVVMPSGAPGRIVSDPPGIDCPGTCSAMLSASEAKLQLARGGLWFAGWSAPCDANDLCRLALRDQHLTVETMFLDGYETTAADDVAAIELSADGNVFLALTDWAGKLGTDGEVVKYTNSGWSGAEYFAAALDGDDFLAAGRSNDTETAFRAMGSRYDADLTGGGSWAGLLVDGNSKATVTTPSGENTALTAGIWSGEATPKVFVAKNGRIYIDDTGLDEAHGLVRLPGGGVRLAASSPDGQFVHVLDANLQRVESFPLAWDAAAFSADGTLIGAEVDGDSLVVSRWSTAGEVMWTTQVDVAVASTTLFVEVDELSIVIAGAEPEEGADGITVQVVRLDHDGEVQWTDSLSGLPGLFGLATNAAGDIALLTGEAAGRTVLGYIR